MYLRKRLVSGNKMKVLEIDSKNYCGLGMSLSIPYAKVKFDDTVRLEKYVMKVELKRT